MKKNYLITLIIVSTLLICSCITIGIMASKLMHKKSKDVVYEIGEAKISSVAEFYADDIELNSFNYSTNNNIYEKSYNYKVKNDKVETIVSFYTEYLIDLDFVTESDNINENSGEYVLEKIYEDNQDSLVITINYTETILNIILNYTYLD